MKAYTSQESIPRKRVITEVSNRNIYVNSLDELNDSSKIKDLFKNASEFQLEYHSDTYTEELHINVPKPVYIIKDEEGDENLMYNSSAMESGKLYEIDWKGERWAIRKDDKNVEFLRFESDLNE